ncbi:MAG: SAM-dependent methyltransferase [Ruminococcaceae bacterium]|nr:SAM-dependent methyltransferase [Oscillospiraceae bacterium]
MNLPMEFTSRMKSLLGNEYDTFIQSYTASAVRALRTNTLKCTPDALIGSLDFKTAPLSFTENGFTFTEDKIGASPAHHAGMFYAQDPSAMAVLAGVTLPFDRPIRALDLCAAPGGKTSQLAAMLPKGSFLVANEIVPSRCRILQGNLERMGVKNTLVLNSNPDRLASLYPDYFDLILVDAPCSGEGMFRKYPEAVDEWTTDTPKTCAERQKQILPKAMEMLSPGGILIYSTCTFAVEENEEIVSFLLDHYKDLSLLPVKDAVKAVTRPGILQGTEEARRFYPHVTEGEGQFMAVFRKEGKTEHSVKEAFKSEARELTKEEAKTVLAFFKENLTDTPPVLKMWTDTVFCAESDYAVPQGQVFAPGTIVGTLQKGRLVPHHALFSAYGRDFIRKVTLHADDPRMNTYLSGNAIPAPDTPDGWAAVMLQNAPVGGCKVVSGMAKNHYPKGLRLKT